MLPGEPSYYELPMGIIGKVYTNSMLVLINSRMLLLSSEGTPSTKMSALKFATVPDNKKDSAIHTHDGDSTLDTEVVAGLFQDSHPEGV